MANNHSQSYSIPRSPASSVIDDFAQTIVDDQPEGDDGTVRAGSSDKATEPWLDSDSVVRPGDGRGVEYGGPVLNLGNVDSRDATYATTMWLFGNDEVKAFRCRVEWAWEQDAKPGIGMTPEYIALMSVVRTALEGQNFHSMVLHEFVTISASKEPPSGMSSTDWQGLWSGCMKINPDKGKT